MRARKSGSSMASTNTGGNAVDLSYLADPEKFRLEALEALMILDTSPEERFDRVVRFAAAQLEVPIALVSFIDAHRQWFKAKVGLTIDETPRDLAFCAHAIQSDEILVVEDALNDPRFAHNALVTGEPHIRFYAGAPISAASGARLGTLCVIDRRPRAPSRADLALLDSLRIALNEALAARAVEIDAKRRQTGL